MPITKAEGSRDGKNKYYVRVNYKDANGKYCQIQRTVYGIDNAKLTELELEHLARNRKVCNLTIRELYKEYKCSKKNELRESSVDRNSRIIKHHILPMFENVRLNNITLPMLQEWKNSISNKGLKLNTMHSIYSCFRALLNFAVTMEYLGSNPLIKLGNFRDTGNRESTKKEIRYYTKEEYAAFISTVEKRAKKIDTVSEWNYYVFFSIAFYMGMRKGEIYGLRWDDIKAEYIYVRRSLNQKLLGKDRITATKNLSSSRRIQMPLPLQQILKEHKKRCKRIDGFNEHLYICGGPQPIRDTTLQKRNAAYAKEAGLKRITIHEFRHSNASLLANAGINIQEIARRLGHSKVDMTWNIYSHLYPTAEDSAMQILNNVL